MNLPGCCLSALAGALYAAPLLASNQVFVVAPAAGPGVDFTNVQSAVNAAGEGDVILIKAGSYASPTISDKALTLVADNGASVSFSGEFRILNLTSGKQVCVRGINVFAPGSSTDAMLILGNNLASVWIEDCDLQGGSAGPFGFGNGLSAHGPTVTLARCNVSATTGLPILDADGGNGLSSSASVCAYDCTFLGGNGTPTGFGNPHPGGDGAEIAGGFFFASGSTFTGGQGGSPTFPCTGGQGGAGLHLLASAPQVATHGCTFAGGAGGGSPSCGLDGLGIKIDSGTHTTLTGSVHHYTATAAPREGQVLSKVYTGTPGEFVFIDFGVKQGFLYFPDFRGVLVLGSPLFTHFQGVINAAGTLSKPSTINEIGAGVEGVPLYTQAAFFDPVTGIIYQSAPSVTVLLDSSL